MQTRLIFIYIATAQVGLVRMCSFILQTLSSNKDYSHKLNKSFTTHGSLPASIRLYAFNGTYADFLIIVSGNYVSERKDILMLIYLYRSLFSHLSLQHKENYPACIQHSSSPSPISLLT